MLSALFIVVLLSVWTKKKYEWLNKMFNKIRNLNWPFQFHGKKENTGILTTINSLHFKSWNFFMLCVVMSLFSYSIQQYSSKRDWIKEIVCWSKRDHEIDSSHFSLSLSLSLSLSFFLKFSWEIVIESDWNNKQINNWAKFLYLATCIFLCEIVENYIHVWAEELPWLLMVIIDNQL